MVSFVKDCKWLLKKFDNLEWTITFDMKKEESSQTSFEERLRIRKHKMLALYRKNKTFRLITKFNLYPCKHKKKPHEMLYKFSTFQDVVLEYCELRNKCSGNKIYIRPSSFCSSTHESTKQESTQFYFSASVTKKRSLFFLEVLIKSDTEQSQSVTRYEQIVCKRKKYFRSVF
jgi:hypothetical protein